jgi:hypothetical protein
MSFTVNTITVFTAKTQNQGLAPYCIRLGGATGGKISDKL